jgi:hypothetical protein
MELGVVTPPRQLVKFGETLLPLEGESARPVTDLIFGMRINLLYLAEPEPEPEPMKSAWYSRASPLHEC